MDEETQGMGTVPGLSMSATIGKLVGALSKAQGDMKAPGKGRTAKIESQKGAYSYSYADLADVIESYKAHLAKHGLAVSQPIIQRDGHLVLMTVLAHESGEWMASDYPLKVYERPQEQGSAITYARRYAVSSLLGIAAEDDDDGKRAQDAKPVERQAAPASEDAAAIAEAAAELEQYLGVDCATLIREASKFTDKEGKERSFSDPFQQRSVKWLKGVRSKLERDLSKERAKLEPGSDVGADLFTDGPA